jgi:membrane protein DedA with SNARE-associated domain
VFLPALLPPPIPLLPFLVSAGALGVPRKHYLLALGSARALRYGVLAWIAATYGRSAVRMWSSELSIWSRPLLWTFVVMLLGSIGFGIWKFRKQAREAKSIYPMDTHFIKGST